MKKWALLSWLLLLSIVLSGIPAAGPKSCPPCEPGFVQKECQCVKCADGQFWVQMNGQAKCNTCTTSCTVKKNLIEITACTKTTDRRCQCKPGFYCPSPVRLTCRRNCELCTDGFTSTANLYRSCQQYTDCASVGMVVIKEGSSTADRVCGRQIIPRSTKPMTETADTPHRPDAPDIPGAVYAANALYKSDTPEALYMSDTPYSPEALYTSDTPEALYTSDSPEALYTSDIPYTPDTTTQSLASSTLKPFDVMSVASETTAMSRLRQTEHARTEREGPVPLSEPLSKTTWIFLLLLLLAVCLVSCLFLQCKRRAIKKKLEWAGRAFGRYQPVIPTANPNAETLLPVSDVREAQGQGSFPGKNQQVTMEHVGKADGINNTVGSIFIYSPGMVILGSNSNEKKEETETSGEDGGEDGRLISVPQQESSSERDIRMVTQEELGKELSVPVPATSK